MTPARGKVAAVQYASKLEGEFASVLQARLRAGEATWVAYEPVTFRLAPRTTYTPDFAVQLSTGEVVFYEVKGFLREDAAVKLKVAAASLPFRFFLVRKVRGAWLIQEVAGGVGG